MTVYNEKLENYCQVYRLTGGGYGGQCPEGASVLKVQAPGKYNQPLRDFLHAAGFVRVVPGSFYLVHVVADSMGRLSYLGKVAS